MTPRCRPEDGSGWPPQNVGFLPNLSLSIGRALGTVVVTVDGALTVGGSELLEGVLTDLIDGQGNRTVVVNLEEADAEPGALLVFVEAARQARRHGTTFILKAPLTAAPDTIRSGGPGDLVEVLPGEASAGNRGRSGSDEP